MYNKKQFTPLLALFILGCNSSTLDKANSYDTSSGIGHYYTSVPVEGISYQCGSYEGITNYNGDFNFEYNQSCNFFIDHALLKTFTPPSIEEVTLFEQNTTLMQFYHSIATIEESKLSITPQILKTITRGRLERAPKDEEEITIIIDFLRNKESTFEGQLIRQEEIEKIQEQQMSQMLTLFNNTLIYKDINYSIEMDTKNSQIKVFPCANDKYQIIQYQHQYNQLILTYIPLLDTIDETTNINIDFDYIENSLQEIELDGWGLNIEYLEEEDNSCQNSIEALELKEQVNYPFTITNITLTYIKLMDESNETILLTNSYYDLNLSYENPTENNNSLIFIAKESIMDKVVDGIDIETPSFDAPIDDWSIPNPDDMTTFDGIRGDLKKK